MSWDRQDDGGRVSKRNVKVPILSLLTSESDITAVYIPPQADTSLALSNLHDVLSGYNNKHPDAAFIIAGDFNKANLKKVMPNFHQHISLSNQTTEYTWSLLHSAQKCLQSPLTAAFWQIGPCRHFPHTGIQTKDRSWTAGGEGSNALVLPLWSYATGVSWWRQLGHVPGEFIWRQRIHGCSIKLRQHANRASHWNCNYKDILQSETVGGQNNPWCGLSSCCCIQRRSVVRKHERVQSIVLRSPSGSKSR